MPDDLREEVKRAFNADPAKHPLRILIATDAAREGVNLQNHCADLFHFDVPWNPSRLEQRNGRIDRKLQRADEVFCRYFVYRQRPEDRVLGALVEKTKTIRQQLGSLAPVLERQLEERLAGGFSRRDADALASAIDNERVNPEREKAAQVELEAGRRREQDLKREIDVLQSLLGKSREWLRLDASDLRRAISCGLELLGEAPLQPDGGDGRFALPDLTRRADTDPSWMHTLDTLRAPQKRGQPIWEWRREQRVRPVVFADQGALDAPAVHLHLEHRFVKRLLGRFRSQGFVHNDLARACIGVTNDPEPRVVLLGRLSLYGDRAARLHDAVLAVAARWNDADARRQPLKPYQERTLDKTLAILDETLGRPDPAELPAAVRGRLAAGARQDLEELRPHLQAQAAELIEEAKALLAARGEQEASEMREILATQRTRILAEASAREKPQGLLPFDAAELKQIEADKRYWSRRLRELESEIESEPERIRRGYDVRATRFEPVGLVYLWPVTG
jgi:hypothetical protein